MKTFLVLNEKHSAVVLAAQRDANNNPGARDRSSGTRDRPSGTSSQSRS